MHQLKLPFPVTHDERHVASYLQKKTGKAIALVLTDNATSMISFRKKGEVVTLRLHRLFLGADEPHSGRNLGLYKKPSLPHAAYAGFYQQQPPNTQLKASPPRSITIK